jgi:hypothetical protein
MASEFPDAQFKRRIIPDRKSPWTGRNGQIQRFDPPPIQNFGSRFNSFPVVEHATFDLFGNIQHAYCMDHNVELSESTWIKSWMGIWMAIQVFGFACSATISSTI